MKWAIDQDDIYNIALSGLYGSGKSSLLKSFFSSNPGYKYLPISLANFDFKEPDKTDLDLGLIEKSILQQMLYSVHESKIADSNFKRIRHFSRLKFLKDYAIIIAITGLIAILIQPSILCYTYLDFMYEKYLLGTYWVVLLLTIFLFWSGYKKIRRSINQVSVEKLSIKNGEISLKRESEESRFNTYLNEIQYFFESNHYDIVVIEDLDRFNNLEIFARLRELNSLINNYEGIKKNGKVVFLYAVRDDLFNDTQYSDRVKFFDFILPVISIMNSSNSFQMLKELLGEEESSELTDDFLSSITLGINDLRLLKNICNEYSVYKHLIRNQYGLICDPKKTFAIAVYKNLHPQDFNKLGVNEGFLFQLLLNEFKDKLVENQVSIISKEIKRLTQELNKLKDIQNLRIEEIKMIFLGLIIQKLGGNNKLVSIYLDGGVILLSQLTITHFEKLKVTSLDGINSDGVRVTDAQINFNNITDLSGLSFNARTELIEKDGISKITKLQSEISDLQQKINTINNRELFYFLDGIDEKAFKESVINYFQFDKESFEEQQLNEFVFDKTIFTCLKHGYIDRSYQLYISHYRKGGMTINDINFVQHINDDFDLEKDFNFKLAFVKDVIERIQPAKLINSRVLNFDLMDYMLKNQSKELEDYILQFKRWTQTHQDFLVQYFERGEFISEFFEKLLSTWENFVDKLVGGNYTQEIKTRIVIQIFGRMPDEKYSNYSKKKSLIEFLKSNRLLLETEYISPGVLTNILQKLNIRLENIVSDEIGENVKAVFHESLWEINFKNICFIVEEYKDPERLITDSNPKTSLYTYIQDSENVVIRDYIDENIEQFIKNVYNELPEIQKEEQALSVHLLNLCEDEEDLEKILIKKNQTRIELLEEISSYKCSIELLKAERVALSWENVIHYIEIEGQEYEDIEVDDDKVLYEYLSSDKVNSLDFSITEQDLSIDKNNFELLKIKILESELSDEVFEGFISTCNKELIRKISLNNLEQKKIKLLIDFDLLDLIEANFNYLNGINEELAAALICSEIEDYLKSPSDFTLNRIQVEYLLASSITAEQKIEFINKIDLASYKDDEVSSNLLVICSSNFNLLRNWSYEKKLSVLTYTEHNTSIQIRRKKYAILLLKENLSNKNKVIEIVNHIYIREYTELFDYQNGGSVSIFDNSENREILEILDNLDLIGIYKKRKRDGKIVIYKKKSK
nr:hypothetical protein [uncultured Fluviicola sp.]